MLSTDRVLSCIKTKNILKNINKNNRLIMGQFSKVLYITGWSVVGGRANSRREIRIVKGMEEMTCCACCCRAMNASHVS